MAQCLMVRPHKSQSNLHSDAKNGTSTSKPAKTSNSVYANAYLWPKCYLSFHILMGWKVTCLTYLVFYVRLCALPRKVLEMNSETWFPDRLISERCVNSRFNILLNCKTERGGGGKCRQFPQRENLGNIMLPDFMENTSVPSFLPLAQEYFQITAHNQWGTRISPPPCCP